MVWAPIWALSRAGGGEARPVPRQCCTQPLLPAPPQRWLHRGPGVQPGLVPGGGPNLELGQGKRGLFLGGVILCHYCLVHPRAGCIGVRQGPGPDCLPHRSLRCRVIKRPPQCFFFQPPQPCAHPHQVSQDLSALPGGNQEMAPLLRAPLTSPQWVCEGGEGTLGVRPHGSQWKAPPSKGAALV